MVKAEACIGSGQGTGGEKKGTTTKRGFMQEDVNHEREEEDEGSMT